ncbi:MAG: hypothetical protein V4615_05100 [Bacteroidota bacterium]
MKAELTEIMEKIITTSYSDVGSIELLLEYGFVLNQHIARTGQLMSEAKETLHRKRLTAYQLISSSPKTPGAKLSPMLLKEYVNDSCSVENGLYELAERANRAATHANDLVRTAISALKQERYSSQFQN